MKLRLYFLDILLSKELNRIDRYHPDGRRESIPYYSYVIRFRIGRKKLSNYILTFYKHPCE